MLRNLQGDIERQLSHNLELLQQLRKFRERMNVQVRNYESGIDWYIDLHNLYMQVFRN